MDIIEGKVDVDRERLPQISALDKIIVAVAGPLFSLLLALVFACIVWVGRSSGERSGHDDDDRLHPAGITGAEGGLRAGDKILEVDGKPVSRFSGMNDSVIWNVVRSEGATIPFKVERNGAVARFRRRALQGRDARLAAQERAAGADPPGADARSSIRSCPNQPGGGSRPRARRRHPRLQRHHRSTTRRGRRLHREASGRADHAPGHARRRQLLEPTLTPRAGFRQRQDSAPRNSAGIATAA